MTDPTDAPALLTDPELLADLTVDGEPVLAIGTRSRLHYANIVPRWAEDLEALELASYPTADPEDLYNRVELRALATDFGIGCFAGFDTEPADPVESDDAAESHDAARAVDAGPKLVSMGLGLRTDFDLDSPQHTIHDIMGHTPDDSGDDPDGRWYYGTGISTRIEYRRRVPAEAAGKITLLNDPRETLGAALKALGYSLNTTDQGELDEAQALIESAKGNLLRFDTDSSDELLTAGESAIAHGYSGDMLTQFLEMDDPSRYVFFVPEEGGTRWIDNMVIPFDAPHPCTAHTFINWMLDGEQGAALSNWNYYGTPNTAAIDGLDPDLNAFLTDPSLLPAGLGNVEEIADTGDFEINYSDAFENAKG